MGQEALEAYTDFLQREGLGLPEPMSMEEAIGAAHPESLMAAMVLALEGEKAGLKRVNISVPSRDLARIDRYAVAHGLTRSAFLIQAARKMIQKGA